MLDYLTQSPSVAVALQTFEAQHPDIRIQRQSVPQSQFENRVLQQSASGQRWDLMLIDNDMTPAFAEAGLLRDIVELSGDAAIGQQFLAGPLTSATWQGRLYGVPMGNNTAVLVHNTKLLNNAGIAPPATQNELRDAAMKLSAGGQFGFAAGAYAGEETTWNWLPYLWGRNGDLTHLTSPEAVDALAYWASFVLQGQAPRAVINWHSGGIEPRFANGQIAVAQVGSWVLPDLERDARRTGLEFGVSPIPASMTNGQQPVVPFGGDILVVGSADPDRARAAWRFVDWFLDTDRMVAFAEAEGRVPAYRPAVQPFLARNPLYSTVAAQLTIARARTGVLGAGYPALSRKLWYAIQQVMTAAASPHAALERASA
jgi:multiple sugar transport system substrate-binding protein